MPQQQRRYLSMKVYGVACSSWFSKTLNNRSSVQLSNPFSVCYNSKQVTDQKEGDVILSMPMAEIFWKLFETTGSIVAYLMYKRMVIIE